MVLSSAPKGLFEVAVRWKASAFGSSLLRPVAGHSWQHGRATPHTGQRSIGGHVARIIAPTAGRDAGDNSESSDDSESDGSESDEGGGGRAAAAPNAASAITGPATVTRVDGSVVSVPEEFRNDAVDVVIESLSSENQEGGTVGAETSAKWLSFRFGEALMKAIQNAAEHAGRTEKRGTRTAIHVVVTDFLGMSYAPALLVLYASEWLMCPIGRAVNEVEAALSYKANAACAILPGRLRYSILKAAVEGRSNETDPCGHDPNDVELARLLRLSHGIPEDGVLLTAFSTDVLQRKAPSEVPSAVRFQYVALDGLGALMLAASGASLAPESFFPGTETYLAPVLTEGCFLNVQSRCRVRQDKHGAGAEEDRRKRRRMAQLRQRAEHRAALQKQESENASGPPGDVKLEHLSIDQRMALLKEFVVRTREDGKGLEVTMGDAAKALVAAARQKVGTPAGVLEKAKLVQLVDPIKEYKLINSAVVLFKDYPEPAPFLYSKTKAALVGLSEVSPESTRYSTICTSVTRMLSGTFAGGQSEMLADSHMGTWQQEKRHFEFLGAQPVTFHRQHLAAGGVLQKRPYAVTWKADGCRLLMHVDHQGTIQFLDRKMRVFDWGTVGVKKTSPIKLRMMRPSPYGECFVANSLFDGELVLDVREGYCEALIASKGEQKGLLAGKPWFQIRYYIYDAMQWGVRRKNDKKALSAAECTAEYGASGESLLHLDLWERRRRAETMLTEVGALCVKGAKNPAKYESWIVLPTKGASCAAGVHVLLKDFVPLTKANVEDLVRSKVPTLAHPNDGLVFTPVKSAYSCGTMESLLKWKPVTCNSVDFKAEALAQYGEYKVYKLLVRDSESRLENCGDRMVVQSATNYDGAIVECVRRDVYLMTEDSITDNKDVCAHLQEAFPDVIEDDELDAMWAPLRIRHDKALPNGRNVRDDVSRALGERVTLWDVTQAAPSGS